MYVVFVWEQKGSGESTHLRHFISLLRSHNVIICLKAQSVAERIV